MSVWREIWRESIECGKETLISNDQKGKLFTKLEEKYPDDAMIIFEEAITFDCMKNYTKAIELYDKAYTILPVAHWKETANYFLQKANIKKTGQKIPKLTIEDTKKIDTAELSENDFQMFGYFYLHSYYHLPHNIRYLAISSLSRIDSEPAIAIVIFRTCLEISLKYIFQDDYSFTKDDTLAQMINILEDDGRIVNMAPIFKILKEMGNDAVHKAKEFSPKQISKAIIYFDSAMDYANSMFKEKKLPNSSSCSSY